MDYGITRQADYLSMFSNVEPLARSSASSKAILGHSSLENTQVYTQVFIGKLKEIHEATNPAKAERSSGERNGDILPQGDCLPD